MLGSLLTYDIFRCKATDLANGLSDGVMSMLHDKAMIQGLDRIRCIP